MNADTCETDFRSGSVEILIFQFTEVATIHCVSPFASEFLDIEIMCAHADFLIRIEAYADIAMLNLRMLLEINHSLHDFSDTSLVVSTEKSVAISYDKVFTLVGKKFWELAW